MNILFLDGVKITNDKKFLENEKIKKILNKLRKKCECNIHFKDFYSNIMKEHSEYLAINNDEIEYWVDRSINLECDSDLLLDLIFRIAIIFNNKENYDKNKMYNFEKIINKILKKV